MFTKFTKSIKSTHTSRVSARTYRARRIGVSVCAILAAVCLWLTGANWGMARVEHVAQADQDTYTSTSRVQDVAKQEVPLRESSEALPPQPTDVQAYRAWLASLPQSLDDIPACQVETGEDIEAETDDTTVYMPVCRWDAALSGNGRGESYVLAYGQRVMPLNYR